MSTSSNQEFPNPWYLNGEASALPPVQNQYASSPRSSPHPWRAPVPYYTFTNAANNLAGSIAPPAPAPAPPQACGHNPQPSFRPMLSGILKRILCDRIAHADSEVVEFHKESCGPGRSRITLTFETSDGI